MLKLPKVMDLRDPNPSVKLKFGIASEFIYGNKSFINIKS